MIPLHRRIAFLSFVFALTLSLYTIGATVATAQGREEITVDPQVLKQYVGTYQLAPNVNIMVTLEGNQLVAQVSGRGKAPISAETETKFF